jgi:hypothetical protein
MHTFQLNKASALNFILFLSNGTDVAKLAASYKRLFEPLLLLEEKNGTTFTDALNTKKFGARRACTLMPS